MSVFAIRPGRNIWVWARTDRDAPSRDDLLQSMGAMMARVFGDPIGPLVGTDFPDGSRQFSIGAARPLDVREIDERPSPLPDADSRVSVEDQPEPYSVKATRVKLMLADFDWRGPDTGVAAWPRRAVNLFGLPVDEPLSLDWLLLDAYHIGEATRPDVSTGDLLLNQLPPPGAVFGGLGLLVLLYFVLTNKKD